MKEPQTFQILHAAYQVTWRHVPEKLIPKVWSDWLQHPATLLARTYHCLNICIKWQAYTTNFHPDLKRRTHALGPQLPYLRSFSWSLQQKVKS
jgi:hypothetical protein